MEPGPMRNAITHEQVVVYSDVGDHLRNVTGVWERKFAVASSPDRGAPPRSKSRKPPAGVSARSGVVSRGIRFSLDAQPGYEGADGWPKVGQRPIADRRLCPRQLKPGDVHLSVAVDGIPLGDAQIIHPESDFSRLFDMPPSLTGKSTVTVAIAVDQVIHEPGGRELGLTFGTIAVQ